MDSALADFRIEDDSVVLLSFSNGSSYRVAPRDLERYLSRSDLTKVQRALQLRKQFISKILPPTALILLVVGVVGLGGYDVHQISADFQAAGHRATLDQPANRLPAPVQAGSSHGAPAASIRSDGATSKTSKTALKPAGHPATTKTPVAAGSSAGLRLGKKKLAPTSTSLPTAVPAANPVPTITAPLKTLTRPLPVVSKLLPDR